MIELSPSQEKWKASKVSRGEYAQRRRRALVAELAPDCKCAECGETFDLDNLEIDHVDGCTWNKRKLNRWSRVARYWREHKEGIPLRALCKPCNGSDGQRFRGRRRYG